MKKSNAFIFVVLLIALPAMGAETGYIQVKSEAGIQVFLDDTLKGITTSDQGGLIITIQKTSSRRHEIKAVREGFQPQTDSISVEPGEVVAYQVHPLIPVVKTIQNDSKLQPGRLLIQSIPIECTIEIKALGFLGLNKSQDRWEVKNVPAGEYEVVVQALGKTMTAKVQVDENATSALWFNIVDGQVTDHWTELKAAAKKQKKKTAPMRTQAKKDGLKFPPDWPFVPILPGSFQMGSPWGKSFMESDEGPQHEVVLTKGFWMSAYETTQAQYKKLMGENPSKFKGDNLPVEQVYWNHAQKFIGKLNKQEHAAGRLPKGWEYRLPTEAQWEYACRAGTETAFHFGTRSGPLPQKDFAWFDENSGERTHKVGEKRPNAWGLYDMYGNVFEWCEDWYDDEYPTSEKQINPKGADADAFGVRVLRGGACGHRWYSSRSAFRSGDYPDKRPEMENVGFRIVAVPTGL